MAFKATLITVAHGDFTISVDVDYTDDADATYRKRHHFDFPSSVVLADIVTQVKVTGALYRDAITKTATLVSHVNDVIVVP